MPTAMACSSCTRALRLLSKRAESAAPLDPYLYPSQASLHRFSLPRRRQISSRPFPRNSTIRSASTATAATAPTRARAPVQPPKPAAPPFDPRITKHSSSEHANAQEVTETLFKECARQADYTISQAFEASGAIPKNALGEDVGQGSGAWYDEFGLTPTFNTWAQVTFLHMYLLTVRLRYLESERCNMWLQHLHDHFFFEAEHRMSLFHKITSGQIRQRYLKEMYNQWRGVQGAYDEGLIKGDAVLAAAVWRNVFRAGQNAGLVGVEGKEGQLDKGVTGSPDAGQLSKSDVTGEAATAQEKVEGDSKQLQGALKKSAQITQAQADAEFDWRRVACVVAFMRRGLNRLDKASDGVIMAGKVRFGNPAAEWDSVVGIESVGITLNFDKRDAESLKRWNKGEMDVENGKQTHESERA